MSQRTSTGISGCRDVNRKVPALAVFHIEFVGYQCSCFLNLGRGHLQQSPGVSLCRPPGHFTHRVERRGLLYPFIGFLCPPDRSSVGQLLTVGSAPSTKPKVTGSNPVGRTPYSAMALRKPVFRVRRTVAAGPGSASAGCRLPGQPRHAEGFPGDPQCSGLVEDAGVAGLSGAVLAVDDGETSQAPGSRETWISVSGSCPKA